MTNLMALAVMTATAVRTLQRACDSVVSVLQQISNGCDGHRGARLQLSAICRNSKVPQRAKANSGRADVPERREEQRLGYRSDRGRASRGSLPEASPGAAPPPQFRPCFRDSLTSFCDW